MFSVAADVRFEVSDGEAGRRLDRVLKKIFREASLSFIYRIIRKDVKVNGRRVSGEKLLGSGDIVEIFLPDEQIEELRRSHPAKFSAAKRQFEIVYEDENILIVNKPFGLLTHGDETTKKNTMTNQVTAYLTGAKTWTLGGANIFAPAPANRLDRNTTGLVLFGKTLPAVRDLAVMLKGGEEGSAYAEKAYLTIVKGTFADPLTLRARMVRDSDMNMTKVLPELSGEGRVMVMEALPLKTGKGYTLVEARLLTGRTHQIRAQLAEAGFPVIGDRKYGDGDINWKLSKQYGLTTQLLHAYRLTVFKGFRSLEYLKGKIFRVDPPGRFLGIAEGLGCDMKMK